ncbi:putative RING and UBP finger domain protein [Pyronema domesticum]|uniref:Similar to RING finger protein ETP1 homolog acc. no. O13747 n=1 Tax=Pyronema omphalodes (strain CBS 100304) TaxID=1076935 RepID=U4LJ12_PYROM|nr:putative RING and UBP finger domain protein [Pyronema domesticum]CCX31557.1 Similar to RING finger protein ETP1 homolog; acc. no. O13747 [Pyronema omphalodes CBS 100304]
MPSYLFHLLFELYSPHSPYCRNLPELSVLSEKQLSTLPDWIPPPNTNIFSTDLPSHNRRPEAEEPRPIYRHSRQKSKSKEKECDRYPDWRFDRVQVQSFDMAPASRQPTVPGTLGVVSNTELTTSAAASKARFIPLESKDTEVGYGVVHLYRDSQETPGLYDPPSGSKGEGKPKALDINELTDEALTTIAVLAVPSYMTSFDFMGFVGEKTLDDISHIRMIRTGKTNRYMVLMKFRSKQGARKFVTEFNGKIFNTMEPENCHVVYVKSIQFAIPETTPSHHPGVFPTITGDPFSPLPSPLPEATPSSATATLSSKPAPPPTPSLLELPTCPVCLERMDETTGLLTILCQHVFHCACLSKWPDSSCPVCRYTQSPHPAPVSDASSDTSDSCHTCGASSNLWICLICGNVGCGRYDEAHAFEHYKQTSHCYAMDIESQRVWDYASDGYVHRLVQNKDDGKLVELPGLNQGGGGEIPKEKLEAVGMEYTYLLTSQLESQRLYFEEKVKRASDKAASATQAAEKAGEQAEMAARALKEVQGKFLELAERVPELEKAKTRAEFKAQKLQEMAKGMEKELKEERKVSEGLMERVNFLGKENDERGAQIQDLAEQVRDLMFYLEAGKKMEGVEEDVREGTLTVAEAPKEKGKKKKGKK